MTEVAQQQPLASAKAAFSRHAWREARDRFAEADATGSLGAADLKSYGTSRLGRAGILQRRQDEVLSPRQTEILACVAAGRTTKEISAQLGISSSTVNWHVARILVKLEASSRAEAVGSAFRHGLLPTTARGSDDSQTREATASPRAGGTHTRRVAGLAVLGLSLAHVTVETWIETPSS